MSSTSQLGFSVPSQSYLLHNGAHSLPVTCSDFWPLISLGLHHICITMGSNSATSVCIVKKYLINSDHIWSLDISDIVLPFLPCALTEIRSNVKSEPELRALGHDQTESAPGVNLSTSHAHSSSFGRLSVVAIWPKPPWQKHKKHNSYIYIHNIV